MGLSFDDIDSPGGKKEGPFKDNTVTIISNINNKKNNNNNSPGNNHFDGKVIKTFADENNNSNNHEKVAEHFSDDNNNNNNLHDSGLRNPSVQEVSRGQQRHGRILFPVTHIQVSSQGGEDTDKDLSAQGEYEFKLLDAAQRLAAISSQNHLRGYKGGDTDRESGVLKTITEIRDIFMSKVHHLKSLRKLIETADIKQLKVLLSSFIKDAAGASKAIAGSPGSDKELSDVGANLALGVEGEGRAMVDYLAGMDREELSSTVASNELIGQMEHAADTLTDVKEALSSRQRRTSGLGNAKSYAKQPPNLGSAAKNPQTPRVSRHLLAKRSFWSLPHIKKHVDPLRAAAGEEGRRHLQQETVAPQCFQCDENEIQCNCRRLKESSLELTWYDVAVRMIGGFVSSALHTGSVCGACSFCCPAD